LRVVITAIPVIEPSTAAGRELISQRKQLSTHNIRHLSPATNTTARKAN